MASPVSFVCWVSLFLAAFTVPSMMAQAPAPAPPPQYPTASYLALMTDIIQNADLWSLTPQIFTANYAFEGIKGVENGTYQNVVEAAGGTWTVDVPAACDANAGAHTTVQTPTSVANQWGYPVYNADAMPVVFSWPVLPSTAQGTDFELTLNTGEKVFPAVASITPNMEYNERHVIVVFGEFGNRISPGEPGAKYVTRVTIVDDGTPLTLVGPGGKLFNAVGLTYDASKSLPYGPNAVGPKLVAAKISVMSALGEGPTTLNPPSFPNDCTSLYGDAAKYRLRMYTSGGFSPDGIRGIYPTDYSTFFRVHVTPAVGPTVLLQEANVVYDIPGAGKLTVLGLADVGILQDSYDACYADDHDNYFDICIDGDEAAVRRVTGLEIPHGNATADPTGKYKGLYNPGGPGNAPAAGVNYTVAGSWQLQEVMQAIDDPLVTSYGVVPATPPPPATASPSPSPVVPSPSPENPPVICRFKGVYGISPVLPPCAKRLVSWASPSNCSNAAVNLRSPSQLGSKLVRAGWRLDSKDTPNPGTSMNIVALKNCTNGNLAAPDSGPKLGGDGWVWQVVGTTNDDGTKNCDIVNIISQNRIGKNAFLSLPFVAGNGCSSNFAWAATDGIRQRFKLTKVA